MESFLKCPELYSPETHGVSDEPRKWTTVINQVNHTTHMREKGAIWQEDRAVFKGFRKRGTILISENKDFVRCCTYKFNSEKESCMPLQIKKCHKCDGNHKCDTCCERNSISAGDAYKELASLTCGENCENGSDCLKVEQILPGKAYIWFDMSQHHDLPESPKEVLDYWKGHNRYGTWMFETKLLSLLDQYRQQFGSVKLLNGGTLRDKWEITYIVIVTTLNDKVHTHWPILKANSPGSIDWSPLLDDEGYIKLDGEGPQFSPKYLSKEEYDHLSFAVHIPTGKEIFTLPAEKLTKEGPIDLESTNCSNGEDIHNFCSKYRYLRFESKEECQETEAAYIRHKRKASPEMPSPKRKSHLKN